MESSYYYGEQQRKATIYLFSQVPSKSDFRSFKIRIEILTQIKYRSGKLLVKKNPQILYRMQKSAEN